MIDAERGDALSMLRYLSTDNDVPPTDDEGLEALTDTLETQLDREPLLQSFVDKGNVSQTHFAVVSRPKITTSFSSSRGLSKTTGRHRSPRTRHSKTLRCVRSAAPLQAKISHHMVPTLVESFVLTVGIIFVSFRSSSAAASPA